MAIYSSRLMKTLLSSTLGFPGCGNQAAGIERGQVSNYREGCHRLSLEIVHITSIHTLLLKLSYVPREMQEGLENIVPAQRAISL